MSIIRPELAWLGGAFRDGVEVQLDGDRIAAVVPTADEPTHPGMALLPGFVNALEVGLNCTGNKVCAIPNPSTRVYLCR